MRPRRLSRKTIPLTVIAVTLPALASFWLLVDGELGRDEAPAPRTWPSSGEEPSAAASSTEPRKEEAPPAPLPPELALAGPSATPSDPAALRARVQNGQADPGVRYAALRRLEGEKASVAVEEAEGLVLSASNDSQGRFLAANALAVLARSPDGRAALERCATKAPTQELRQAARVFLARLSGPDRSRSNRNH